MLRTDAARKASLFTPVLVLSLFGLHCSGSGFTGNSAQKTQTRAATSSGVDTALTPNSGDAVPTTTGGTTPANNDPIVMNSNGNGETAVSVPVGSSLAIPNLDPTQIASCTSSNTGTATVDPKTCQVSGVTTGTTNVSATLVNGTHIDVAVTVTPSIATDGASTSAQAGISVDGGSTSGAATLGGLTSNDGIITSATGQLCLGGPACNVSFLLKTSDQATACMHVANNAPCNNDSSCGAEYKLQVCNCTCTNGAGLTFDDPSTCTRSNPLKSGAHPRLTECTKI